jgi:DNA repair photolyase
MPLTQEPSRFEFVQARTPWRELGEPHPQYRCRALLDPYQGCALGCRYCFGATEESFHVMDPSICRVGVKTNLPYLLSREIKKRLSPLSVLIGAAADPYQPAERRFRLTRRILELFINAGFPIHVLTKSEDVLNDVDLLAPYSEKGLAVVTISLCSLKPEMAEWLEPYAPPPSRRLSLMRTLARRGVVAGVALSPVFPRLTDNPADLKELFRKASSHGASYVLPTAFCRGSEDAPTSRFLQTLEARFPGQVSYYRRIFDGGADDIEAWRGQTWEVLKYLSDQHRVPLHLPVDGAAAPESLPAVLWE